MFKKIWNTIKTPFVWVHEKVKKIAPGLKTKIVAGLGALGSLAALLSEYFAGVPLAQFIGATEALLVTTILFSLAFWFRTMGK